MLKVFTTHMKEGWLRRNGVPRSDQATMVDTSSGMGIFLRLSAS